MEIQRDSVREVRKRIIHWEMREIEGKRGMLSKAMMMTLRGAELSVRFRVLQVRVGFDFSGEFHP